MATAPTNKVLLIGWDAADWKLIDPLLQQGKMPNLQRLIDGGVRGNLTTLHPPISPMLWTSIATGKRPYKHGVLGFTEPDPHRPGSIRPVSSLSRTTRALWNILNLNDRQSNVVGWWPSFPAEPIQGVMVSNHFAQAVRPLDQEWPVVPGSVHPSHLAEKLATLRIHPTELTEDVVTLFVPEIRTIDIRRDPRPEHLLKTIAEAASVQAIVTALMQLQTWDFTAVYFDAIDHFGHAFMNFHPPKMDCVSDRDFQLYSGVMEAAYRFHDMMLGFLMHLAGDDTTILLVSDHGFQHDAMRHSLIPLEPAGPTAQHRQQGILVMHGPGVRRGERLHGASVLDITPTILHLFGLPIGEDMDGTPLVNGLKNPDDIRFIPSWDHAAGDDGSLDPQDAADPAVSAHAVARLVALGYLEKPSGQDEETLRDTIREMDYNLARAYLDGGRYLHALPLLEKLSAQSPEEFRFSLVLAQTLQSLGRTEQAGALFRKVIQDRELTAQKARAQLKQLESEQEVRPQENVTTPDPVMLKLQSLARFNPAAIEFLLAGQLQAEHQFQEALTHIDKALQIAPGENFLLLKRGEIQLQRKEWAEAAICFEQVLRKDSENVQALLGLTRSALATQDNNRALFFSLDAVELQFTSPDAHFLLGVCLQRNRKPLKAAEAFRMCLLFNPDHTPALNRLAQITERRLNDPVKAEDYRRRAEQARNRSLKIKAGDLHQEEVRPIRRFALNAGRPIAEQDPFAPTQIQRPLTETIVVVSGLPRSGTSMMMQMLTAGGLPAVMDNHRPADVDNQRGYFEDQRATSLFRDSSWIPDARGRAVKVVAQLLRHLPSRNDLHYGVIFMLRDVHEVLKSQVAMLQRRGQSPQEFNESKLADLFQTQLSQVQRLLAIRGIPVLYVQYRDCLINRTPTAERINRFLGGQLSSSNMAEMVEPNLARHTHVATRSG